MAKEKKARKRAARKISYVARDPAATRKRILSAAIDEFGAKGFNGARVENIVKSANSNMRMLYHYFDDKEKLYIAVIEDVYRAVREAEQDLHVEDDDPKEGIVRLVDFTFKHFAANPNLINIVMNENILHAAFLKKSDLVPAMTSKLSNTVSSVLRKGYESKVFIRDPDPKQLWLTIFALCWVHLANRYTMSWTLQIDLTEPAWLESRRKHVVDVVLAYLCAPEDQKAVEH